MIRSSGPRRRRLRLINPRSALSTITLPDVIRKMTFSRRALFAPLNLTICAAVVPDGWDAEIVDENVLDAPHTPDAAGIDAVGIGAMTTQAKRAYALADAYRKLGVPVILGGIHPSALPEEALEHADVVCKGDAEGTLPGALDDLAAALDARDDPRRAVQLPRRTYDWRELPEAPIATPRKDLLDPSDYLVFNPIQTTRGCPHGCTFCTTPSIFGRRFRRRSIDEIVDEVASAKAQFGTETFIFSDDNVAGNHAWAMELFERLKPLKIRWASQCDILVARSPKLLRTMRDSGCIGLLLGLESPKANTLHDAGKRYVKAEDYLRQIGRIHAADISIWGSFIFGFDTDDWRDCMNAVRFAQKARLVMSCYTILTPYPGTAIFEQYRSSGRLLTTDWDRYNGATVVFRPKRMSVQQLRHAQMSAFNEFFAPPSALRRLRVWPLKKRSWVANVAVHRGLCYYYHRRNRPLPRFADNLEPDARDRIAWALGEHQEVES